MRSFFHIVVLGSFIRFAIGKRFAHFESPRNVKLQKIEDARGSTVSPLTPNQLDDIISAFPQEKLTERDVMAFYREFVDLGGTFGSAKDGSLKKEAVLRRCESSSCQIDFIKQVESLFKLRAPSGVMSLKQFIGMSLGTIPNESQISDEVISELRTELLNKRKCLDQNKLMNGLATIWPGGLATEEDLGPCWGCNTDPERVWHAGGNWTNNKKLPAVYLRHIILRHWPALQNESTGQYIPCLAATGKLNSWDQDEPLVKSIDLHLPDVFSSLILGISAHVKIIEFERNLDRRAEILLRKLKDADSSRQALEYFQTKPCPLNPNTIYDLLLDKWEIRSLPIKHEKHKGRKRKWTKKYRKRRINAGIKTSGFAGINAASLKDLVFSVWQKQNYPMCLSVDSSGDDDFSHAIKLMKSKRNMEMKCLEHWHEDFCRRKTFNADKSDSWLAEHAARDTTPTHSVSSSQMHDQDSSFPRHFRSDHSVHTLDLDLNGSKQRLHSKVGPYKSKGFGSRVTFSMHFAALVLLVLDL